MSSHIRKSKQKAAAKTQLETPFSHFELRSLLLSSPLYEGDTSQSTCVFHLSAVYIDGAPLWNFITGAIFLEELLASLERDGVFEILTCWCGSPSCAGIEQGIRVFRVGNDVFWLIHDPFEARFRFEAMQYRAAIEEGFAQMRFEIAELEREGEQLEIVPDLNISLLRVARKKWS